MWYRWSTVVSLAVACLLAAPAAAINIVPVFNAADNETPAFDLFNGGIQDLFDYAETYYQDIFEDPGYTLTVNFWYEDLQDNDLGLFNPVTEVGHRLTEANVRIDTRVGNGGAFRDWYIDATPASDSEFEMEKNLWIDGSPTTTGFVAPANTPNSFEVGYRGAAPFGSPAHNQFDMLSTILHELGHALGIRAGADHENADGDYDMNPDFLFGVAVAARVDGPFLDPDPSHVASDTMLMCGECALTSWRRRPSHADLFAIATSSDLVTIDVPRREFYGGGVFGTAASWSGGRTPDNNDEAFVHDADLVVMNASDTVAGLTISYAELATGSNNLTVNGTLRVDSRFSNVLGKLIVASGGTVSADHVEVANQGEIDMAGGTLAVDGNFEILQLNFSDGGFLSGAGTVTVAGQLTNQGTIKPDAGTLSITAGSFDLGGINSFFERHIDATTGSVVFNGPHVGTFKGIVDVGFGQLATFNGAWTLDALGEANITDGGLINNATWHVDGSVDVNHTVPFGIVGVGGTGRNDRRHHRPGDDHRRGRFSRPGHDQRHIARDDPVRPFQRRRHVWRHRRRRALRRDRAPLDPGENLYHRIDRELRRRWHPDQRRTRDARPRKWRRSQHTAGEPGPRRDRHFARRSAHDERFPTVRHRHHRVRDRRTHSRQVVRPFSTSRSTRSRSPARSSLASSTVSIRCPATSSKSSVPAPCSAPSPPFSEPNSTTAAISM